MELPQTEWPLSDSTAERYQIMEKLGTGCITSVYRAVHVATGRTVAIKRVRSTDAGAAHSTKMEYDLLRSLPEHRHIIKAIDYHVMQGHGMLVLEFFDGITLHDLVLNCVLSATSVNFVMIALFNAIGHVHAQGLLHRDVKPQNILVSHDCRDLRLIDFNVASLGGGLTPTGTTLYKAPELLLGEVHSTSSDVWASALCIFFALTGTLPQGRNKFLGPYAHLDKEVALLPISLDEDCWQTVSQESKALLTRCLALNPEDRPEIVEVLREYPWMQSSVYGAEDSGDHDADFHGIVSCSRCLSETCEGQLTDSTDCPD
jgi:serine/threonine-protein kinase